LARDGHRVASALHIKVEHHFDPSRLTRTSFITALQGLGRSQAYLQYHWRHFRSPFDESAFRTRSRLWVLKVKHRIKRLLAGSPSAEGLPTWESYYVRQIAFLQQSLIERTRPRRYKKYQAGAPKASARPLHTADTSTVPPMP
jgi:hypothetical protein